MSIPARYESWCPVCEKSIEVGDDIVWIASEDTWAHEVC